MKRNASGLKHCASWRGLWWKRPVLRGSIIWFRLFHIQRNSCLCCLNLFKLLKPVSSNFASTRSLLYLSIFLPVLFLGYLVYVVYFSIHQYNRLPLYLKDDYLNYMVLECHGKDFAKAKLDSTHPQAIQESLSLSLSVQFSHSVLYLRILYRLRVNRNNSLGLLSCTNYLQPNSPDNPHSGLLLQYCQGIS